MVSGPICRALADRGGAAEERRGLDDRVVADRHVDVDRRGGRVDDRHAVVLVGAVDALLGEVGDGGEVDAVVDAEREVRVGERVRLDGEVLLEHPGHDVGEVELALGVVGAEGVERVEQRAAVEAVQAGVDLADGQLGLRRVAGRLRLHHALHPALRVAHDAAVARRVLELHRGERGGGLRGRVRLDEARDRLGGDQRHVAVDDHDGRAAVDVARRGGDGVPRAARLLLDGDLDAVGEVAVEAALRVVDDHDAVGAGGLRREQGPEDHRAPADRVEDLGERGAHARPLARGEEDHGGGGHGLAS